MDSRPEPELPEGYWVDFNILFKNDRRVAMRHPTGVLSLDSLTLPPTDARALAAFLQGAR